MQEDVIWCILTIDNPVIWLPTDTGSLNDTTRRSTLDMQSPQTLSVKELRRGIILHSLKKDRDKHILLQIEVNQGLLNCKFT